MMKIFQKNIESRVVKTLQEKITCEKKAYMPMLKGKPVGFWASLTGQGFETDKLPNFILEWEDFDIIIKKANKLGGKMYRGDALAQLGGTLGETIPYDCMEGVIADSILGIEKGKTITRRSTYYSGILAWAGIVTIHKSQGQGSFIIVNEEYRKI